MKMNKKVIVRKEKVASDKRKDLSDKLIEKVATPKRTIPASLAPPKKVLSHVAVAKPVVATAKKTASVNAVSAKKSVSNKSEVPKTIEQLTPEPAVPTEPVVKNKPAKKDKIFVPEERETYFVYLKSPLEYRRHLLESSRKILLCLKSHQTIVLIRRKKFEEMNNLRASVKELLYLNKKFNDKLPKYKANVLGEVKREIKEKTLEKPLPKLAKQPIVPREKTEMEKLEESLANIEKKLQSLQ